jgi:hypothetical protein
VTNTKQRGDRTEARAIHEFIASGCSVSVPFGDNDRYDLVVDDGDRLRRVQCKTAWPNKPNTIRFNTHSQTTVDGEYEEMTYEGAVDGFAVWDPEGGRLYWVPVEAATTQKMELRFEGEIDHPAINWAETYAFDGEFPD